MAGEEGFLIFCSLGPAGRDRNDGYHRKGDIAMKMDRRKFFKILAAAAGGVALIGGGIFILKRDTDVLDDHFAATEKVLSSGFGRDNAAGLMRGIHREHESLVPGMPDIGGRENLFTEWLIYGVYYLSVYRVLRSKGLCLEEAGKTIFDTFRVLADHPKWLLKILGNFKYNKRYVRKLKLAVEKTQERRYPDDWVATFVQGDGEAFDYGIDITECGICKFYRAQGAEELAPYLCLSDYVVSNAFDRGLVRYKTVAEGADVCDFRYKSGRETFVSPLRAGWPPRFRSERG